MEYYCHRYKFGKPDIDLTASASGRKNKQSTTSWEAVMTVGGRRIGMGAASNKKAAKVKCYLDVTQYLQGCDAALWQDFIETSKSDLSANLGLAPHLVFQMSDELNEDIYGLCGDIRQSLLHKNAPAVGFEAEQQTLPVFNTARFAGQASGLSDRPTTGKYEIAETVASGY